jgi:asparagine synthase (glutamine-hydrolysing)
MCGIAGILASQPDAQSADVLERMLRAIWHRGPDEGGRLIDGPLAMGMRRLSIIDVAEGAQPMFDEARRFAVVFNGEIYNYRELRKQLLAGGHRLTTQSDTETIVHLYEEHGPACVNHLRGMFGLAVWDNRQQELFIARDRMGIKPLYYTQVDQKFIFASEIKAILMHPQVRRELDLVALSHYLSLKYVPGPRTLFAGIQSLEPGHWLRIRAGAVVEKRRYWDVRFAKPATAMGGEGPKTDAEYTDRLHGLLRESVGLHLRSDVPFGAFLSGGVDSSTLVGLMSEQLAAPVKAFSVGFDGDSLQDELPFAKQVAAIFGCEHHVLKIGVQDFLNLADDVLWHLDQPLADQATIATHMVAKLARQHVKMVLTGEGGDELFAGYARYAGERYSRYWRWLPKTPGRLLRALAEKLPGLRRAKIGINALTLADEAQRFANWFPMFKDDTKHRLLTAQLAEYRGGAGDLFAQHLAACDAVDPVDRMLYVDSKLYLVDHLLFRGDKLTMANSLEARVPLLDHKLVEFAAQLPVRMKLRGATRKFLLKQVARRILPPAIIDRKKQGFPIPIDQWLRREAAPLMRDLLSEQTLRKRGLFDGAFVHTLIKQHVAGYADHATELWGLMSLEMWMRSFLDVSYSQLVERVDAAIGSPHGGTQATVSLSRGGP